MDILYVGSEIGPVVCNSRKVVMKTFVVHHGEKEIKFRLWCVHYHTVRLLSGMYPSQRVLCTTTAYPGNIFPHAIKIETTGDLYMQLLRFEANYLAWSAPLRV